MVARNIDLLRSAIPQDCFTDVEVTSVWTGSANRRHALIKRAVAQGDIVHIRRGLYCLSEKYRRAPLNLFGLAQRIYGPSYVSLESALSHHGWIPEAVHSITSVSSKRSATFKTPLGPFVYYRIPSLPLFTAVERIEDESGSTLMARPWKAIADYIYVYKKDWLGLKPLQESLRIEDEQLQGIDLEEIQEIQKSFRSRRVIRFLESIGKEMR